MIDSKIFYILYLSLKAAMHYLFCWLVLITLPNKSPTGDNEDDDVFSALCCVGCYVIVICNDDENDDDDDVLALCCVGCCVM